MNKKQGVAGQNIKLLHGDCLVKMKELDNNSVDSIITDPPYGISFMSQKWDKGVPTIEIWQEALRVLKPGGTALIFTGCRLSHRMVCNIEDAGFIIFNKIMWCYGNGFPKSYNISKGMDKYHGAEREVIGKKISGIGTDKSFGMLQNGENINQVVNITKPMTDDAKMWDGFGTDIAPSYEEIIMCRKPNYKNNVENALKYGVAGLNIKGAGIYIDKAKETDNRVGTDIKRGVKNGVKKDTSIFGCSDEGVQMYKDYRFPKNMILDEVAAGLIDEQSGQSNSSDSIRHNKMGDCYSDGFGACDGGGFSDKGGASRYFKIIDNYKGIPLNSRLLYIPKASKAEKNRGCESLDTKQVMGGGGLNNTDDNVCGKYGSIKAEGKNIHPTVKPILLMEYLCMLTKTPTGGTVLDPFMGSGTTGIGCVNTERDFIGIDMNAEYLEIARLRIEQAKLDYQPQLFEA